VKGKEGGRRKWDWRIRGDGRIEDEGNDEKNIYDKKHQINSRQNDG
jgi:hypothetical protein